MEATARYAAAIGLTNVPRKEDWNVIQRLLKIYAKNKTKSIKNKLRNLCTKREAYAIPELLKIIALDKSEFNHLMICLYKNELERDCERNSLHGEIYEEKEYWKMGPMEAARLKKLLRR